MDQVLAFLVIIYYLLYIYFFIGICCAVILEKNLNNALVVLKIPRKLWDYLTMCNFIIHLGLGANPRVSSVYHLIISRIRRRN